METLAPAETLADNQSDATVPVASETLDSGADPAPCSGDTEVTPTTPPIDEAEEKSRECLFLVGDLVWGKIKNHPWWPGQVYDTSRASERAQKTPRRPERSLLVAYFGDDTFSWCEPSQLKPFFPEFKHLSKQAAVQNKGFTAAVAAALEYVAGYLESQFARCSTKLDEEDVNNPSRRFPVDNFTSSEFLGVVHDVARDVTAVDLLETTMLRTWVLAFCRGRGWAGETYVYHHGKEIKDLVDKIDLELDAPLLASMEECEEGSYLDVSIPAKGLDASKVKSLHSKKKRNVAAPVVNVDLNSVEIVESYTEKCEDCADKNADDLPPANDVKIDELDSKDVNGEELKSAEIDGGHQRVEVEQGIASEKRERKKSKYLSPPYTNLAKIGKLLVSSKGGDNRGSTPKIVEKRQPLSPSSINAGSFGDIIKEINENDALMFDARPTSELLSDFLATALNILHLKWNRPGKTVVGFFALYRCSVYCSGSGFKTYQMHFNASCGSSNGKVLNNGIKAEGSTDSQSDGKDKKRKAGANKGLPKYSADDILPTYDQEMDSKRLKGGNDDADAPTQPAKNSLSKHVTTPRKRKAKADEINNGVVLNPNQGVAEHSVTGLKRMMREAGTGGAVAVPLNVETCNGSMNGKSSQRAKGKSKINANGGTVSDLVPKSGRKRQKSKTVSAGAAVVGINLENTDHSCGNQAKSTTPAVLLLTFAPGTALPSKDHIISVFGNYGGLIESETVVLKESWSVSITFSSSTDAVKAFNDQDRNAAFKPPAVSYNLCNLPGNLSSPLLPPPSADTPLPYIRRNLEMMISTLGENSSSSKDAVPSDLLKPEAKENLVDEMQGLLLKVNKLLTGSSSDMPC